MLNYQRIHFVLCWQISCFLGTYPLDIQTWQRICFPFVGHVPGLIAISGIYCGQRFYQSWLMRRLEIRNLCGKCRFKQHNLVIFGVYFGIDIIHIMCVFQSAFRYIAPLNGLVLGKILSGNHVFVTMQIRIQI